MKRKALFVGVNDYDAIPKLKCCLQDASALNGLFTGLGFDTLLLDNPEESEFKKEFTRFTRELTRGDSFVFYFAGHGFTRKTSSDQILAFKDSSFDDIELGQGGIAFNYIERKTNRRDHEYDRAFILDACRSDLRESVRGFTAEIRDLAPSIESLMPGKREGGVSCCVLRSCKQGECAQEIISERHGLFTLSIIDVVREAREKRTRITLGGDFHKSVCRKMAEMRKRYNLPYEQCAEFRTDGITEMVILDGVSGGNTAAVSCPECGQYNLVTETFKCKVCGRDHLCRKHYDETANCCADCAKQSTGTDRTDAWRLFEKAEDFYYGRNGIAQDYAEAARWYRKAAELGNADAQCALGVMYHNGYGVAQNDAEAAKWYRKAAEQGHIAAQLSLGILYDDGRGVEQDYTEAAKWYRAAAEQGNDAAQFCLGYDYEHGEGVEQSDVEAAKWYRKAAEQGYAAAQFCLGLMYADGRGVEKDDAEAVKWYRAAAEQGNARAQNNLGLMYDHGRGVEKDDAEAVKWYRAAAEQGDACAQYNLGLMYQNGQGVPQDYDQAEKWYRKAAELGNNDAKEALDSLKQSLEESGMIQAQGDTGNSLGARLRNARLAKGYSIAQVASQTGMLPRIVEDLEKGDYRSIPAAIYGRGFVRLYAECVGLDPVPLVAMFMAEYNV